MLKVMFKMDDSQTYIDNSSKLPRLIQLLQQFWQPLVTVTPTGAITRNCYNKSKQPV